jgi:hypothetical protein
MSTHRPARGSVLLENMIALAIVMICATGTSWLQRQSLNLSADARKTTRAMAFAHDLVDQIRMWEFDDPRLANVNTANDGDIGDVAGDFMVMDAPPFDHDEAGLGAYTGVSRALLDDNAMQRFWNVSTPDDDNGNGIPDNVRVAVIVRWRNAANSTAWRTAVFVTAKSNPGDRL